MSQQTTNQDMNRRQFLSTVGKGAGFLFFGGVAGKTLWDRSQPATSKNRPFTLASLMTEKLFPGRRWSVLASTPAFIGLGKGFCASDKGKAFLKGKSTLTFLYPAAGTHLAPLGAVAEIAENAPDTRNIKLIYTEINESSYATIDRHLKTIVDNFSAFSDFKVTEKLFTSGAKSSPKQKLMTFQIKCRDERFVHVELLFEFKRSGKAYFLPGHFDEADIVIVHDITTTGQKGSSWDGLEICLKGFKGAKKKPKMLFSAYDTSPNNRGVMHEAFGKVVHVERHKEWGCGPNHRDAQPNHHAFFSKSAVIALDSDFLVNVTQHPPVMEAFLSLVTFCRTHKGDLARLYVKRDDLNESTFKARKDALAATETILLFLAKHKTSPIRKRLIEVLLTFFTERFFPEAFGVLPALTSTLSAHLVAHPDQIDIPGFNPEVELMRQVDYRGGIYSRIGARRNRLLLLQELIDHADAPSKKVLTTGLSLLVEKELSQWQRSPGFSTYLKVYLEDFPAFVYLVHNRKAHIIRAQEALHAPLARQKNGYFQLKIKLPKEFKHPGGFMSYSFSTGIFEYFMALLHFSKKFNTSSFSTICTRIEKLGRVPAKDTYSRHVYDLCMK